MTPLMHQHLPDTPENRELLLSACPDYSAVPRERRPAPFFLIARRGFIGWVTGPDAAGADFLIAQWTARSLLQVVNKPRSEIEFVQT